MSVETNIGLISFIIGEIMSSKHPYYFNYFIFLYLVFTSVLN